MNKAVVAIREAKRKIGNPMLHKWIDRYHGANGAIAEVVGFSMAVDGNGVLAALGGSVTGTLPRLLTWADATTYAQQIDALNVGADHLNVKLNVDWCRMYQLAPRNVSYMAANGTVAPNSESTLPCHNCGIVLPLPFLQVDHMMPQAGGEDLHLLKTLRALGLATSAATGAKGLALGNGTLLTTLVIQPKARDRSYNHLANATPAAKWTTSDRGDAFLSLLVYAGAKADVARMCKNSLLNLVPLCPECNRVKSDWIRPIV